MKISLKEKIEVLKIITFALSESAENTLGCRGAR